MHDDSVNERNCVRCGIRVDCGGSRCLRVKEGLGCARGIPGEPRQCLLRTFTVLLGTGSSIRFGYSCLLLAGLSERCSRAAAAASSAARCWLTGLDKPGSSTVADSRSARRSRGILCRSERESSWSLVFFSRSRRVRRILSINYLAVRGPIGCPTMQRHTQRMFRRSRISISSKCLRSSRSLARKSAALLLLTHEHFDTDTG